jgi:hypothetical protein
MKSILLRLGISLGLGLLSSCPSEAQQAVNVNYGRGPTLPALTTPGLIQGLGEASYSFSPQTGVICPTSSFSVGGFGAGGNDWSNDYTSNGSAGAGVNNFGVAAGLRVPLGGESARTCKEYARYLTTKARIEMEGVIRNDQLLLLAQCHWLLVNEINTKQAVFEIEGQPFYSLNACNSLSLKPLAGRGPSDKSLMNRQDPPLAPTPPSPTFTIQQNVR